MNNSRQGISELLTAVILISMAITGGTIIYTGLMGISYENLECEIQRLYVYEIDSNKFWGTLRILNNGDFIIDDYDIMVHNESTITLLNHTKTQINTDQSVDIEFEIDGNFNEKIRINVEVKNQQQTYLCGKSVKI